MVRAVEGEPRTELPLPDLITSLDLNGIKDEEARKYWIGRAEGFTEWLLHFPHKFENQLLTGEVVSMIRETEKEDDKSLFFDNSSYYVPRYMRGIIDKDIVVPDGHEGPKNLRTFSFEKAFAFLVFHREMVERELMNQDDAYKIAYQKHLEKKFGSGHKLLDLFNPKLREPLKPRPSRMVNKKMPMTSGSSEPEEATLPLPEKVEELLRKTTREELIKLWEQIEPFRTFREAIGLQKVTEISPPVIWEIVLMAEMIHLREKRAWTDDDVINVKRNFDGFPMHLGLPEITYRALAVYTETLIEKMSVDGGEDGKAKNLFELKEKAANALQERLNFIAFRV